MSASHLLRALMLTSTVVASLAFSDVAGAASDSQLLQLQIELEELVEQEGMQSAAELEARVARGLPPAALSAVLDACREHPRSPLEPVVRQLSKHRGAPIRARALLALAEFGPSQSVSAIKSAADDHDRGVRRLALVLHRLHPSDRADAITRALLERDPTLAAEHEEDGGVSAPQSEEAGS